MRIQNKRGKKEQLFQNSEKFQEFKGRRALTVQRVHRRRTSKTENFDMFERIEKKRRKKNHDSSFSSKWGIKPNHSRCNVGTALPSIPLLRHELFYCHCTHSTPQISLPRSLRGSCSRRRQPMDRWGLSAAAAAASPARGGPKLRRRRRCTDPR